MQTFGHLAEHLGDRPALVNEQTLSVTVTATDLHVELKKTSKIIAKKSKSIIHVPSSHLPPKFSRAQFRSFLRSCAPSAQPVEETKITSKNQMDKNKKN